jgi:hypothetical protein
MTVARRLSQGLIGGAAGVLAMSAFMKLATRGATINPQESKAADERRESSTAKLARLAEEVGDDRNPTPEEKRARGNAIHLAYGTAMGGLFGVTGFKGVGAGVLYGASIWLVADEVLLPVLGLSGPPESRSLENHIEVLMAHTIYGAVLGAAVGAFNSE